MEFLELIVKLFLALIANLRRNKTKTNNPVYNIYIVYLYENKKDEKKHRYR